MQRPPEALVARLRNRKRRLITLGILIVILLGLIAMGWLAVTSLQKSLVPKEDADLLLHVVSCQVLLPGIAFLQSMLLLLAAALGAALAAFLGRSAGLATKDDLLVNLWDRVQALEQSRPVCSGSGQTQEPEGASSRPCEP